MATCTLPYKNKATRDDPLYGDIVRGDHEAFWDHWSLLHKRSADHFSTEFRSLVCQLLAYDLNERMSLESVLECEWLQGDLPSVEQVLEEMSMLELARPARSVSSGDGTESLCEEKKDRVEPLLTKRNTSDLYVPD